MNIEWHDRQKRFFFFKNNDQRWMKHRIEKPLKPIMLTKTERFEITVNGQLPSASVMRHNIWRNTFKFMAWKQLHYNYIELFLMMNFYFFFWQRGQHNISILWAMINYYGTWFESWFLFYSSVAVVFFSVTSVWFRFWYKKIHTQGYLTSANRHFEMYYNQLNCLTIDKWDEKVSWYFI